MKHKIELSKNGNADYLDMFAEWLRAQGHTVSFTSKVEESVDGKGVWGTYHKNANDPAGILIRLWKQFYYSIGVTDIPYYHLVDMYYAGILTAEEWETQRLAK